MKPLNLDRLFRTNDMIEVFVGDGSEHWVLNRDFLYHRMPSLKARLDAIESENPDRNANDQILLKQVEPPVFAMALDWFMTGNLRCTKPHSLDGAVALGHFTVLCALYVFAEKYELPRLSVVTIDRIKTCTAQVPWKPTATEVRYVFKETHNKSVLRSIVVKEMTKAFMRQPTKEFKEHSEEWAALFACHPEFHAQMLHAIKVQFVIRNAKTARGQGQGLPIRRRYRPLSKEVIDLTVADD